MKKTGTIIFLVLTAMGALAGEPVLTCTPHVLTGIPGEPLTLELTIDTEQVTPVQLEVPAVSNLVLRTVEKIPVQRTPTGHFIQKRILIWQGTEAGTTTLTNLMICFQAQNSESGAVAGSPSLISKNCPAVTITVSALKPALPPAPKEETE